MQMNGLLAPKPGQGGSVPVEDPEDQQDGGADEAAEGDQADQSDANVTPEEQQAYDVFVAQCMKVIYAGGKVQPAILDSLKQGKPTDALAHAAVAVVDRVVASGQQAGHAFEADVIFHGGREVVQDLAEVSQKAGLHDYTQDELDGAFYVAVDLYRTDHAKDINPGAAQAELSQLQQADQGGKLNDVLPGIDKFKAPAPPSVGQPMNGQPMNDQGAANGR